MAHVTLAELAAAIGAEVVGNADHEVNGLATLAAASPQQVSFLANKKYQAQLDSSAAGAIIVHPEVAEQNAGRTYLVHANPYLTYAKAAQFFERAPTETVGIHPTAFVDPTAQLGEGVAVGPNAVIAANAQIGAHTVIGAQCNVGEEVVIGAHCRLWPQVSIYHRVIIGDACTFHSGAVIGADGFGWAHDGKQWIKIPQLGSVSDLAIGGIGCQIPRRSWAPLKTLLIASDDLSDNGSMIDATTPLERTRQWRRYTAPPVVHGW